MRDHPGQAGLSEQDATDVGVVTRSAERGIRNAAGGAAETLAGVSGGNNEEIEMRTLLLVAAWLGLLATEASAQYWGGPPPPPPRPYYAPGPGPGYGPPPGWRYRRDYGWCEERARRLHAFEFRSQRDGFVSRDEARIAASLRADLQASCGGGRWHPNRGWYVR